MAELFRLKGKEAERVLEVLKANRSLLWESEDSDEYDLVLIASVEP